MNSGGFDYFILSPGSGFSSGTSTGEWFRKGAKLVGSFPLFEHGFVPKTKPSGPYYDVEVFTLSNSPEQ